MNVGYYIGLGDRTTCGGTVIDGDPGFSLYGLLHACEGDRVTCGKDGKTYRILGGISHMISEGRQMAGTLDSRSGCPCRAQLLPSVFTATYRNETCVAPTTRAAQPTSPPAARPSATPHPSGFAPSNSSPPGVFNRVEPQEPGFYVVPESVTREALEATLFPTPDPAVMRKFRALNPHQEVVKAGSMIVLSDPNNLRCSREEAQVMAAVETVNAALEDLTPEQADFMHRHAAEIASFTGQTSTWLGVSAVMLEKHLNSLRDTLQAMERLHQNSFRQHGHLRSPQFFAERKLLLAQLDAHLLNSTRLRSQTSLGDHPKLKTALGISSKSLVHHWNKAGAPGQIPGYATHVEATSRAAKHMQMGGHIGIGVGAVSSLLAIQAVCNEGSEAACEKVRFTETGKFLGATGVGALAGLVGKSASSSICLRLGRNTRGIGWVVCVVALTGAAAWEGADVGGEAGEYIGENLFQSLVP